MALWPVIRLSFHQHSSAARLQRSLLNLVKKGQIRSTILSWWLVAPLLRLMLQHQRNPNTEILNWTLKGLTETQLHCFVSRVSFDDDRQVIHVKKPACIKELSSCSFRKAAGDWLTVCLQVCIWRQTGFGPLKMFLANTAATFLNCFLYLWQLGWHYYYFLTSTIQCLRCPC